jgi:hypothetical protein
LLSLPNSILPSPSSPPQVHSSSASSRPCSVDPTKRTTSRSSFSYKNSYRTSGAGPPSRPITKSGYRSSLTES